MYRGMNELAGFWIFRPVSASVFSALTVRTRKVQRTQMDTRGQLSTENSFRSTPLFREGGRNGNSENGKSAGHETEF